MYPVVRTRCYFPEPFGAYEELNIEGWTVLVSLDLLHSGPATADLCLRNLRSCQRSIARQVPPRIAQRLHHVSAWLEPDNPKRPGGLYYSTKDFLVQSGGNPDKARCVEFTAIAAHPVNRHTIFHEYAHAWHDRFLSYDNPAMKTAYDRALQGGRYDIVERSDTGGLQRAYALTNHREFFAELSVAWFGESRFFPHNREQLAAFDPESHDMIAVAWGGDPLRRR